MNRLLTFATALALGLTLCGTAKANIGDRHRFDHDRFNRAHPVQIDREVLRFLDPRWFDFDHDEFRRSHPWLFQFNGDDLRYFEHHQFISTSVIPSG
jgi:hypothetical protein